MLSAVFAAHKLHTPRQEADETKKAYVHRSVLGSSRHCDGPSCPAPDPLQRGKTSSRPLHREVSGRAEADVAATKADVAAVEEFAVAPVQADNTATMQWGLSAEVVCCRGRRCESKPSTPLPDTGEEPLHSAPPILGRRRLSSRYGKCNPGRLNRAPKLFSSHCSLEARMSKRSRRDGESIRSRSASIATEEVNTAGSHSWKMKPHLLRLVRQSACRGGVFVCQLFGSRQSPRSVNEFSKQERHLISTYQTWQRSGLMRSWERLRRPNWLYRQQLDGAAVAATARLELRHQRSAQVNASTWTLTRSHKATT